MLFVWRGIGIVVPIIVLINGFIVRLFIEDDRIGNPKFMGWTLFYSAIVCLLLGITILGTNKEAAEKNQPKKKHDFFFIPIIFWALIFGGISAWLLIGGKSSSDTTELNLDDLPETEEVVPRSIFVLNQSDDTISYLFADSSGVIESEKLPPHIYSEVKMDPGTYIVSGSNLQDSVLISLPYNKEFASVAKNYVLRKDAEGNYYERVITAPTKDSLDYDKAWFIASANSDMIFVDVTDFCKQNNTAEQVKAVDWLKRIGKIYDGHELIEPDLKPLKAGGQVTVLKPGEDFPQSIAPNERVFMIYVLKHGGEPDAERIANRVISRLGLEEEKQ